MRPLAVSTIIATIGLFLGHNRICTAAPSQWQFPRGTTAVVTGGTSGIGKAVVEELASFAGVRVLTCARNSDALDQKLRDWSEKGWDCAGVVADVSTQEGRDVFVEAIREWLGDDEQLDILVNNVGTNIRKPSVKYSGSDIDHVWKTNFESMFGLTVACHDMLRRDSDAETTSSVVNIGSVAGE